MKKNRINYESELELAEKPETAPDSPSSVTNTKRVGV
jgi:hypothetical protein